jgi:hypothetical protein
VKPGSGELLVESVLKQLREARQEMAKPGK